MTVMVQLRTDNDCQKAIPCTWVLMNNKSTDCYLRVFQFLAEHFKNFRPKYSMTDYEIALRNSLKEVFPGIKTKTCYFHYSQALIKNAQDKKLIDKDNSKEERPELFIVLNRLKLLALLPAEFIESVYEKIEKECLNDFGDYFRDYLNYYKKQWWKQEGAEQISVYKLRNRTNNFLESYHKQLNTFISKKPKHNVFVGAIKSVAMESRAHFSKIIAGKYEGREQKQETVTRNAAIEEFWRKIEGISEDINGDKRFQELLRIIDQMPEIESLKQKEGEKIKQLIKNIKEQDEGIVKYDRLGLIQIRKISNNNDMLEDLKFYRRRCFATDEKIVFRVEHIE
ncbi:uncharacterized protein LOC141529874 isoform X1 [Cotesia typhae]|uniref:uncharacterized protein LOC141529874 isoform X1 n=1 Tax=Cotesia typhae TaxID=2053667 RepID=UPI003D693C92